MENILNHLNEFKYIYLVVLLGLLVLLLIIMLWRKRTVKVKPIQLEEIETKEEPKSELEDVIAALETNQNNRPMTTFEQEQEENAIISYQELVAAVQGKMAQTQEPKEVTETVEVPIEEVEEVVPQEPVRKFKNSEFISPVFGKDTKTNDDFLKELKDLRRNL